MARWLLGLLAAAWLLFAVVVVLLHGLIVPRIGEWRGLLETQASRVVGAPIRIGAISARSDGLFPTFELSNVVLQDAQQRDALHLSRVVASVSPRSLWFLGFEQLYVEKAALDVRLSSDGRLFVAGLDVSSSTDSSTDGNAVVDWFFSQREFVIAQSSVRWTDESRGSPPLLLSDVQFVARNGARRHQMRLDATPPEGWGERFSVSGRFRAPLLSTRRGEWQRWDGQLHAQLPHIDVTRLGQYVTLDARIREGRGALRAWVDVKAGQPVGATVDLALSRVNAVLGAQLQPLVLRDVTGRVSAFQTPEFFEFATEGLQFTSGQNERWPGGNLWFRHEPAQAQAGEAATLRADQLDLGALALIADRLPLAQSLRKLIADRAPQGLVEHIELGWQGAADAPTRYHAKGRVTQLSVAGDAATAGALQPPGVGTPGVHGLTADFELDQDKGHAQLRIDQGALDFPGVFAEPSVPIESASARLQWKLSGDQVELTVPELRFANADAQGSARATWRTADATRSGSASRFPGVLDLQGSLTRADGTRVWRYLPLAIPSSTRDYVRDAVRQGTATAVDFRVRGDLWDMPFDDPKQGDFRIAAKVRDVQFAYVPPLTGAAAARAPADDIATLPWPALASVSGELIFERSGMQVRNARGHLAGAPQMEVFQGQAQIADMSHDDAVLSVDAQMRGPLNELTRLGAPLLRDLPDARAFAGEIQASGPADYRLQLQLPLSHPERIKVQAQVAVAGNPVRLLPGTPLLTQTQGRLRFTETGFSLDNVKAHVAGGPVQLSGRGRWDGAHPDIAMRADGQLSAQGLRGLQEWPWLTGLAQQLEGSTAYNAQLGLREGRPSFEIHSDLQGLSLPWPAPFHKAAADKLPLRVAQQLMQRDSDGRPARERFELRIGEVAAAEFISDVRSATPQLVRGALRVGPAAVQAGALPDSGVLAAVTLPRVDLDAWRALMSHAVTATATATSNRTTASAPAAAAGAAPAHPWMPTRFDVRTDTLAIAGRTLHQVALDGSREGTLWRAQVQARELSGNVAYSAQQAGRLYARLERLKIEASAAQEVESLLDEQPHALPALDVVVNNLELMGRALGKLEVQATNQGGAAREWRLSRLNLHLPEAEFRARGRWSASPNASPKAGQPATRRTGLDFELDIRDAGALLARFGMKDVLARGRGSLSGQAQWQGSPFAIDYPSLAGQMRLDVQAGQFLKAEPGIAKLLGVLNLQALPRRFTLDFRDLFSAGFAFDSIQGDARIGAGVASTHNLQMKGVGAAVLMEGWADIAHETQKLRVVVVPEINAGTAALVATAINPAIGLGAFLAQAVLSRPLVAAATREFEIDGTWTDPRVVQVPHRSSSTPPATQTPSTALAPLQPSLPSLPSLPALPDWTRGTGPAPTENTP